jgi:putative membrane protein
MKKAEAFFTKEEQERIRQAVVEAEKRSSGEIVPMVVDQSGNYREFLLTGSILATFLLALIWTAIRPETAAPQLLLMEMITFWVVFILTREARRLWAGLIPDGLKERVVRRRAEEEFHSNRLHETRDRTGVLILISLLEHRVQILADAGIHQKVSSDTWQRLAQQLTLGMKSGQACQAFCDAIAACGQLLAEHFPRRPDDTDELPNVIVAEP